MISSELVVDQHYELVDNQQYGVVFNQHYDEVVDQRFDLAPAQSEEDLSVDCVALGVEDPPLVPDRLFGLLSIMVSMTASMHCYHQMYLPIG